MVPGAGDQDRKDDVCKTITCQRFSNDWAASGKYYLFLFRVYQDTFTKIEVLVPGIQFVQGSPDSMLDSINRNLFIIDMMGEKDTVIAKLFTKKSHHGNLSVIYIVQNLFHQSKDHRTISLNASLSRFNEKRPRSKSSDSSCQTTVS